MRNLLVILATLFVSMVSAQSYYPTNLGTKTSDNHYQAFTEVTLHPSPGQTIENATLLVYNGKVVQIGTQLSLPKNTVVTKLKRHHIYPSFIDLYSTFGVAKAKSKARSGRSTQYKRSQEGGYWNDHIQGDYQSVNDYAYDKKKAKTYREAGFGVVNTHRADGIYRGTGLLVALTDDKSENDRILEAQSAAFLSFDKSKLSNQSYPSSVMGSMALLRQLYHDTEWYSSGNSPHTDLDLQAVLDQKKLPKIFEAKNKLNVLRAARVSSDVGSQWIIKGSGKEYEQLEALKKYGNTLLLPLNFPKAFDVKDAALLKKIPLSQMRYWNQAPTNPAKVAAANIPFAFTMAESSSAKSFLTQLKQAVANGLPKSKALAALTTTPAEILGQSHNLGTLKKGAWANFILTSGPLFEPESKILSHFVKGNHHKVNDSKNEFIDGSYTLALAKDTLKLEIIQSGQPKKIDLNVSLKKENWESTIALDRASLRISITHPQGGIAELQAKIDTENPTLKGSGTDFEGATITWEAKSLEKKKKDQTITVYDPVPLTFPNNGFGFTEMPKQQRILFKNATVWTNEEEGILNETDVLIDQGKILAIGSKLKDDTAVEINASGKHLTSGIIDEHSHIAASSINEGGQNSSAEVTIEDVIDPDDIDIYRNLSGGVTTIQILHGSANPIGGRSAIIKLKWGASAEKLLFPKADPFIKFALGENVKQSNWGSYNRFPQTRMGVEQMFVDYFQRAQEYGVDWTRYNNLSVREKRNTPKPRYDIEMETLWEILRGDRFISCHSYVQSEINMLMKVAERFGIRINTFTHILEGYKVADKMASHGAAGSTFSDWWAYKYEVKDAIPYNGAIMHRAGVTVAFNSDDAEMSRRLNQEAAKAVKYGGISEEEAWKFVTLNPAKMLHLDNRIGSIKVGKDADLVLWSHHPMSIYAQAEKTLVDGIVFYDAERARDQEAVIAKEKEVLIAQMKKSQKNGGATQAPKNPTKREFHCETLD
ncbi:MAG: amidohydrolase family protein [Flavobacteriaceae bacterium]